MLVINDWVAAMVPSVNSTFSNSSPLGGRMEARLLTFSWDQASPALKDAAPQRNFVHPFET